MIINLSKQWVGKQILKRLYSTKHLLKPFYMLVHPDLFQNQPDKQKVNEESLKLFHSYMNDTNKSKYDVTLNFFVKQQQDCTFNARVKVTGNMSSTNVIQKVLKACRLPYNVEITYNKQNQETNTMKIFNSLKNFKDPFVSDIRNSKLDSINSFEESGLSDWIAQSINIIHQNQETGKLHKQQYDELVEHFQRKYHIRSIYIEQQRYSYATVIRALKHFENLIDREIIGANKMLDGVIIKLDRFNGLDQVGRFLINVHAIPGDWKQALLDLHVAQSSLSSIKILEKAISDICFGIKLTTRRQGGSFPVKFYENALKFLLGKLQREDFFGATDFSDLNAVFDRDSDSFDISPEGHVVLHPYMKAKVLFEFCLENCRSMKEQRKFYLRGLKDEQMEIQKCKDQYNFQSFEREAHLSSAQVLQACSNLQSINGRLLENLNLIISNYYSVSTDGFVRIPWNYKTS